MTREQIYRDMEDKLGIVPSFFKELPDSMLEHDWESFKVLGLEDGFLGLKTKNLIGLGVAGAIKCRYCAYYHMQAARASGATDDEIHEALRFAMDTAGWSTFLNGLQIDYEEFKRECDQIHDYVSRKQEEAQTVRASV